MRRKKEAETVVEQQVSQENGAGGYDLLGQENPQFPPREEKAKLERFSVYIDTDGKLDLSRFKSKDSECKAKEVLQRSFQTPEFQSWLGVSQAQAEPLEAQIPPQIIHSALQMFVRIQAGIESRRLKLSMAETVTIIEFNPEQHLLLDNMGASIANKYIPLAWRQKMDLIVFASMMIAMVTDNHMRLVEYAQQKNKSGRENASPPHASGESTEREIMN